MSQEGFNYENGEWFFIGDRKNIKELTFPREAEPEAYEQTIFIKREDLSDEFLEWLHSKDYTEYEVIESKINDVP